MIGGVRGRPAVEGEEVCPKRIGPVWALGGETCGCILPIDHEGDHECSCGSWWCEMQAR